jgi:hypothetical protein
MLLVQGLVNKRHMGGVVTEQEGDGDKRGRGKGLMIGPKG